MDSQSDLSLQARSKLIQSGFEALANKSPKNALAYFGAAIRKAKRVKLWDIEAEFYKFVTLYLEGDYPEAVQRCIECLDGVKMFRDEASSSGVSLPFNAVITTLESCLAQAMVMRRDSLFSIIGHFWQIQYGEFYLLKKNTSFFSALLRAWQASSLSVSISFDLLKNELKTFSAYLQSQLDKETERKESDAAAKKREAQKVRETAMKTANEKKSSGETKNEEFLAMAQGKGFMNLSDEELATLIEVSRTTKSHRNLVEIGRLIDILGPNSKKPYLQALADNPVFDSPEAKSFERDRELSLLLEEILSIKQARIDD